jgi:Raf kinase inhibitor-like YbhB/YbcL family protein
MLAGVRRIVLLSVICVTGAMLGAGCRNDGRTLRPARPDQNRSISTTTTSTIDPGGFTVGGGTTPPSIGLGSTTPSQIGDPSLGALTVTADWSEEGGEMPADNTCDGANVSPQLSWSPAPAGTAEIAIGLVDQDAPEFGHWLITGISAASQTIAQGEVPAGATQAVNSTGTAGYTGPCPPLEQGHIYEFTVYFLSESIGDISALTVADARSAAQARVLTSASVTGSYSRI